MKIYWKGIDGVCARLSNKLETVKFQSAISFSAGTVSANQLSGFSKPADKSDQSIGSYQLSTSAAASHAPSATRRKARQTPLITIKMAHETHGAERSV
jgi:hypothetical protein